MSTYLQGINTYIPEIQEFKPDFNFYSKSLQMSQSKYDANHERISNLYGSLLNSPMLREKNIEERDQFFKVIDQDIKKISGMDLSKQQNVTTASTVFNQLLDNKNIHNDMVKTKILYNQKERGNAFRNCIDPAKCGGAYSDISMQALDYWAQDFRDATDEEAMSFDSARFTPAQDVMGKAIKLAKEADLNITIDEKSGNYMVTTKNGPNLIQPLSSLFTGTLGRDPAVMDWYTTQAYVNRKQWVNSKVEEYGSVEAAENAWIEKTTQALTPELTKTEADLKYTRDNLAAKTKQVSEQIAKEGTMQGSPLAQLYEKLNQTGKQVSGSLESITDSNGNLKVATNNRTSRSALKNLDKALAGGYLQRDIRAAAETLAFKDYSITKKADEFSLEAVRQKNRMIMEGVEHANAKDLEKFKFELEAKGTAETNEGYTVNALAGGVNVALNPDGTVNETAGFDQKQLTRQEIIADISRPQRDMVIQTLSLAFAAKSNPTAHTDLVGLIDEIVRHEPSFLSDDPAEVRRYRSMGIEEKLNFIQSKDLDYANKITKMSGLSVDKIYDNAVFPRINRNELINGAEHSYLQTMWTDPKNVTNRINIANNSAILSQLDSKNSEIATMIKANMRTNSKYSEYTEAFDALITKNGVARTKEQFIENYVNNAVKAAPKQMYVTRFSGKQVPAKSDTWMPTSDTPEPTDYSIIKAEATSEASEIYDNMMAEDGLVNVWKKAWGEYYKPAGATNLSGTGSEVIGKAKAFIVQPEEFQSTPVVGINGFYKDAMQADADEVRFEMGSPTGIIPAENDIQAATLMTQLITDIRTRSSAKDNGRPVPIVTYQNIAGGNPAWTMVNIKLNDAYVKQMIGTEANPGMLWEQRNTIQKEGFNAYLKKSAATNQFYINAKTTPLESLLYHNKEYKIDDYPEYTNDLKITKLDNGGYNITGEVAWGVDTEGNLMFNAVGDQYISPDANINDALADFKTRVYNPYISHAQIAQAAYNKKHNKK